MGNPKYTVLSYLHGVILVNKNCKKLSNSAAPSMFLPTIFFIAGIRYQNIHQIAAVSAMFMAAIFSIKIIGRLWCSFVPIAENLKALHFFACALCMLCGALHGSRAFSGGGVKKSPVGGNVSVTIVANTIKIRSEACGIFYGYGTIGDASVKADILRGGRIFFSVQYSSCGKIPLCGQEFTVRGRIRRVGNGSCKHWFQRHLRNMRIDWNMQNCCLLSCAEHAPPLGKFFRKILHKFLRSISVGVENMETERSIMSSMLTGNKCAMSDFYRTMFNDLGIAHLFAVSGIHIGLIAATIDFLMRLTGMRKNFRVLPTLLALTLYVNAIGCSPSALRALSMVAFYYMASLLGRRPNVLSALTNSALLQVLRDPFVVFNISFLLSYSVVSGIILVGAPLKILLSRIFLNMYDLRLDGFRQVERIIFRIKRCLIASFSISFASYFISLPLTVEYFGSVSLLTIPVNMIVVPIGTCAIIIGAITLFFGLVDMWWVCAALNRISYAFIYAFQILSRSMYNGEFCRRNVNLPLHISGPCVTMIMLLCAHVLFTKKLRSISLGRWSECGDEHGNGAGKCVAHGGSA